ncbi:hypothetical protein Hden_3000 [Hyphomicrobium denitrificans ATCC 51888]|uniref:Uncharacterized protein n=1 Tax=Hyphomicrobium denitrificans (strain ATCC 51888 / DSM 1869 / NCIMB 11706 / TK 0415) TaxID=582899 RepID=D8JVE1_HYPDA|nr:hypothetical protein Hden_3000 [Hyphomicrobium denitrificans ATCC 51888]
MSDRRNKIRDISAREAERILGHRVDRRRKYAFDPKPAYGMPCVLQIVRWTDSCSGCFEGGEYGGLAHNYDWDDSAQCRVGIGCDECGYSGKVRREEWVPYLPEAGRAALSTDEVL